MDAAERAFTESMLQTQRSHLRVLEQQAATFGAFAPPYVVTQIEEYKQKIAELEARLRPPSAREIEGPRHNLPPRDYEQFVGRQKELTELRRLLGPDNRAFAITIDGIGGIGKSSLALETAYTFVDMCHQLVAKERFEAIVWVSAKRTYLTANGIRERQQVFRTLSDVFAAIARVLDYPAITQARIEEQRAIVEQVLREQRTLLILDNLETIDDEALLDFLHELPQPTKALITTRHRIDVARTVRLTGMEHADALNLIAQESIRKGINLSQNEQEELWHRTGGVPLAIVWSIGLMGLGGSIENVLHKLGSGQSDIARFCFEESLAKIRGHEAHRLLLALSLFTADASREALGVVAGFSDDIFGRDTGLENLLRLSLTNKENDRFSLLPLTRIYVESEVKIQEEIMSKAQLKWHNYFLEFVDKYGGWSKDWLGHKKVEKELLNIFAVLDSLLATLQYIDIQDGIKPISPTSIPLAKKLLKFARDTARTCRLRGEWNESIRLYNLSVRLSREVNDIENIGWRCRDLSRLSYYQGDMDNTRKWALEARSEWLRGGFDNLICYANRFLGLVAIEQENFEEANILLTDAMDEYIKSRNGGYLHHFMESIGDLHTRKGDFKNAANWYQKCVDACRKNDDIPYLASNLIKLGSATLAGGNSNLARNYYDEGLKFAEDCGRVDVIARARYGRAMIEQARGNHALATSYTRDALDLFRRLGMKREQAEAEALLAKLNTEPLSDTDVAPEA